jgi:uncharacterized protein (UPF0276 family)
VTTVAQLPKLGAGLGYRRELHDDILANADRIDWLEIITENFMSGTLQTEVRLAELRGLFPLVPHGIEMSIGSPGEVNGGYIDALAKLVSATGAPYFSDHLCFTRAGNVSLGSLTPLPRSRTLAKELGQKAQRVQDAVGVPFILENITYHVDLKTDISEAEFIAEFCEHCDCGLLLDVTNLHTNAVNHHFDPLRFLDTVPAERIVQVHLAGGVEERETLLDSHSAAVPEPVWVLFDDLLRRVPLRGALIERDQDFPDDFTELLSEVERIRTAMDAAETARERV